MHQEAELLHQADRIGLVYERTVNLRLPSAPLW